MSDLSSMSAARSELARMHAISRNPDPDRVRLVAANLVCARLDNRTREYLADANAKYGTPDAPVRLNGSHVAHLVGLLLSESGVGGETCQLLETLARDAVKNAQADR